MKKLVALLILASISGIFYSCADDTVTSPLVSDAYDWNIVYPRGPWPVTHIFAVDSQTAYIKTIRESYKYSNWTLSEFTIEPNYYWDYMESYNSDYLVFSGYNVSGGVVKILEGSAITTINIPSSLSKMKIVAPGKIFMIGGGGKYYIYNNSVTTQFTLPNNEYCDNIIKSDNQYYLITKKYPSINIYKFDEGSLTLIRKIPSENDGILSLNNKMIWFTREDEKLTFYSYDNNSWNKFYRGRIRYPQKIAGEDISSLYALLMGEDVFFGGYVLQGEELARDMKLPAYATISDMKQNMIFTTDSYGNIYTGRKSNR